MTQADHTTDAGGAGPVARSPLPDPDSPIYLPYRVLGRATVLMTSAAELLQIVGPLQDPALERGLRWLHGRSLKHLMAAQRELGLRG